MASKTDMQRVFLALWPDTESRAALARVAARLDGPGRAVPTAHLHLTLAFAGPIPATRAKCLSAGITQLATDTIELTLDQLGHFSGPRITWIGPSAPPQALATLAERAQALCDDCSIDTGPAQPFRPHVSLRRHADPPSQDRIDPPVCWRAATVVLVESGSNGHPGRYRILART
ncbi:RNA 2',3'-cyclic phosphodiesterase [Thioalkalivibrio sp. ALJT]|uniref:RNA 2',3'-cyclic phosphodiesterase n=1 Tax=Thioalkalivibrio sp. ALJT TaxID=1158146 RepID=UPI00036BC433|nr:RNA 2',3'-cyclic phosphodiesterase [Thioalkalivibrio sp. ALJT]